MVNMKSVNLITGALCGTLGIFVIIYSLSNYADRVSYGISAASYPAGLSIILLALSLILIVSTLLDKKPKTIHFDNVSKLLKMTAGTIAYLALLKFLGFIIATPVVLFILFWLLGQKKLPVNAAIAIGVTVVLVVSFRVLLSIPLPRGPFGF